MVSTRFGKICLRDQNLIHTPPKTYIYDTKNDGLEEVSPASTMAILGSYAAMLDFRAVLPILPVGVRNVPTPTT